MAIKASNWCSDWDSLGRDNYFGGAYCSRAEEFRRLCCLTAANLVIIVELPNCLKAIGGVRSTWVGGHLPIYYDHCLKSPH